MANRVLLTLVVAAAIGAALLSFVAMAPNRLVSGEPINLIAALRPWQWITLVLLAMLLAACALTRPLSPQGALYLTLIAAPVWLVLVLYGLGDYATRTLQEASASARVSQGAAFWILVFCPILMMLDAFQRLHTNLALRGLYTLILVAIVAALFVSGHLDGLAIMYEYANNRDQFTDEFIAHLRLVASALSPALAIGLPLGLLAHRRAGTRGALFGVLNFFQTIPSIALFALLVAPLAALSETFPLLREFGIKGIGATPAIIALVMYALLPIVRNTYAGFNGVAATTLEAARGMGMTSRQILWRVEIPLALPVILAGLRIVTVQAIGLAVVAALIGAGGLGAFIFQGLGQYAIDLVLLGAIPTIALAVVADFILQILVVLSRPPGGR